MKDLTIERADVYVCAAESEPIRLAEDMNDVYQANVIVRLTTNQGLEGLAGATVYTENEYDLSLAHGLRPLLPEVMGRSPAHREAIWQRLMGRYSRVTPSAQSLLDIALWDLAAKWCGLPLYQMLGGARESIEAYASTPLLDTPADYVAFVQSLRARGFNAIKLHTWCDIERDLALVQALREIFSNTSLRFMIDLEERYTREEALRLGQVLAGGDYVWLEAPLPDTDLTGYRWLRQRLSIPVIPAGNTLTEPALINHGIAAEAWDALRIDVTHAGGITQARRIMALGAMHSLNVELQSWGYSLTQAANLHMMLAHSNCRYFELPVPPEPMEEGARTPIRLGTNGHVFAPEGAGLGIEMEWDHVTRTALTHFHATAST